MSALKSNESSFLQADYQFVISLVSGRSHLPQIFFTASSPDEYLDPRGIRNINRTTITLMRDDGFVHYVLQ